MYKLKGKYNSCMFISTWSPVHGHNTVFAPIKTDLAAAPESLRILKFVSKLSSVWNSCYKNG